MENTNESVNSLFVWLIRYARLQCALHHCVGDHLYTTSAKGLGGWGQKMAFFADVLYCIYSDIVGEWVGGSEKVQKYADVV